MNWLEKYPRQQEVYNLSPEEKAFEEAYLSVREKEGRLLSDELVSGLPVLPKTHALAKEWEIRQVNSKRLLAYLQKLAQPLRILDLGCGNGWFTHLIAERTGSEILGLDINSQELAQAARLFTTEKCHFAYADIFSTALPVQYFDIVICNASIQYFQNLKALHERLQKLSKPAGEWHIIDSPFYASEALVAAKERSANYYTEKDIPEMNSYYFHHMESEVQQLGGTVLYQPKNGLVAY